MPPKPRSTEPAPATQDEKPKGFEASLRIVEQAVTSLESGSLDLDDALAAYEIGVKMLARCHALLDAAEKKVQILGGTQPDGSPQLSPFGASGSATEPEA